MTSRDQDVFELASPLRFVVFGRPQGKGSKRVLPIRTGGRADRVVLVDSNRNARPWATRITEKAREAYVGDLIRHGVHVELAFYFARPKGHFGAGSRAAHLRPSAPREMITMPDVDKLARCAIDALTGVVLADDSQIVELIARKLYGEPERLEVCIREL